MKKTSSIASVLKVIFISAVAYWFTSFVSADSNEVESLKLHYQRPAEIPFPSDNPFTTQKAELGKMLFFDTRLSGNNTMSCASCHNPSFSWGDGLPLGVGSAANILGRRTPTILNLAWQDALMWDGRFESLEEQALGPMSSPDEMNQDMDSIVDELKESSDYDLYFSMVFPGEGLTVANIARAIATYERTIVSNDAPFDRWIGGQESAISESAKRGFELFNNKANCAACHSGWAFTDGSFHDIGLNDSDIGRGAHFSFTKMQHAFKTPTLRNVVERAPYMHDGSIATLGEVVRHYNDGFVERESLSDDIDALDLTEQEIVDLVEFMKTLSSNDPGVLISQLP